MGSIPSGVGCDKDTQVVEPALTHSPYRLYVSGRFCLFGEHSDWAGGYRRMNSAIEPGLAIVVGTECGIGAAVSPHPDRLIVRMHSHFGVTELDEPLDSARLREIAAQGGFWSYIAGTTLQMITDYHVRGIRMEIDQVTLPVKKGLSSSAAVCVLVARAFSQLYDLRLTTRGEMELAYRGELCTPSRCGRMDQACAYGRTPVLMKFDADFLSVDTLSVREDINYLVVELGGEKDTIQILADLNQAYPFPASESHQSLHEFLGATNHAVVHQAVEAIASGDHEELGWLMNQSQQEFDRVVAPLSPKNLASPLLHRIINDNEVQRYALGLKGVGSHGDGIAQILVRSHAERVALSDYISKRHGMDSFTLTIPRT